MLWVKALHIVFVVTWFAGLFYLPRLFVYHAQATDREGIERFKIMERKLLYGIMTPSAVLAIVLGDKAEEAFRQSLLASQGSLGVFWSNGLVGTIMALGLIALFWPIIQSGWAWLRSGKLRPAQ